ncbi:prephenate dehydrogenase [Ilumatobacter sp.]|uniref:prephenate dehydrogenase n=1 Tax=Ilumatobacter sp. TaxID=1967498 RepID=UPI003C3DA284
MTEPRSANVIGLGLIGGSIAAALGARGWSVAGVDDDGATAEAAVDRGVIQSVGLDPDAMITFVAVPVTRGQDAVRRALAETTGIVTDVGSVKGPLCAAIDDPRFVGGHPMAGSERDGLDGADPNLFEGAIWVLTPDDDADDLVFSRLTAIVSELGAEILAIAPDRHDEVVAVISHVPHLTAASLMGLAADRSIEHAALLRLAAGGFRDMTRVASGRPDIWLDICEENRSAIVGSLTRLIDELAEVRAEIDHGRRDKLRERLDRARDARANLPSRVVHPESLAEVRIPIPDRAGAAAEVFVLAADLSVNIANFEVVHVAERNLGVVVVLVDQAHADVFRGGLLARGFRPSVQALT